MFNNQHSLKTVNNPRINQLLTLVCLWNLWLSPIVILTKMYCYMHRGGKVYMKYVLIHDALLTLNLYTYYSVTVKWDVIVIILQMVWELSVCGSSGALLSSYWYTYTHKHIQRLWKLYGLLISRILEWPSDTGLIVMFWGQSSKSDHLKCLSVLVYVWCGEWTFEEFLFVYQFSLRNCARN